MAEQAVTHAGRVFEVGDRVTFELGGVVCEGCILGFFGGALTGYVSVLTEGGWATQVPVAALRKLGAEPPAERLARVERYARSLAEQLLDELLPHDAGACVAITFTYPDAPDGRCVRAVRVGRPLDEQGEAGASGSSGGF